MPLPHVSIIMNCYNNASTLHEALKSVYAQTFTNFEIILYDNGSTDQSLAIANDFATLHNNLHIYQDFNRISLGYARNKALSKARGNYIAFLDCDDIWLATKLEKQVRLMEHNKNIALVCTDAENFMDKPQGAKSLGCVFESTKPHRGKIFTKLIKGQWITMSSAMLRRTILENCALKQGKFFDEKLNICEEAELFYRLAHDAEFDYIDEVLTKRRIHEHNTTFTHFAELASETEYLLKRQYELYADFNMQHEEIVRILTKRANFQRAIALWREGNAKNARALLQISKQANLKEILFYMVSFLPPIIFPYCVRLYLKLSKYINA